MSNPSHTPMFEQYRSLKAANPDAILFFRVGDFYETFFEDAVTCARELEITLTSRNKADAEPIPLAGVPHHNAATYIHRLCEAGFRVAIADQVEDPALAKGLVKREVVRVVTPGVTLDPTGLDSHRANWLAAIARGEGGFGLAFLDVSTGDFRGTLVPSAVAAGAELARLTPKEILLGPGVSPAGLPLTGVTRSVAPEPSWRTESAERTLAGLGGDRPEGALHAAAGAALAYARDRLGGRADNVHRFRSWRSEAYLVVDEQSSRNLEIHRTAIDGRRRGSLVHLLDLCGSPMGSRRLSEWLSFPLQERRALRARQLAVGALVDEPQLRSELRARLAEVADIERIGARVAQGTAHARDLVALGRSLAQLPAILTSLRGNADLAPLAPEDLAADVAADVLGTLVDDPPFSTADGGLIREGVDPALDELMHLSIDSLSVLDRMEDTERRSTGIASLKIRKNNIFGYFIEVTTANLHKVPDRYLRKQTLSNCERYVTGELQELEGRVLGADSRRKALELELFRSLRDRVQAASDRLAVLAGRIADLDVLVALAEVAVRHRWVEPVVDDGLGLQIVGGRHPMVEAALVDDRFVPNDLWLDPETRSLALVTGPNMAGKSTVLRQVALIVLLAHVGSRVPAESARIGLCDRIFTRVGAADDLRKGQSTFMVEMAETSTILHHATERSLVVLDEIGRGTSTYDGLAIAWSVAEDLHDRIRCRALFATHYHELCELTETRPRVANLQVAVSEQGGDVVFLRRLVEGAASRSYGIQCARLAGLPEAVVARATRLLVELERRSTPVGERRQLRLFEAPPAAAPAPPTPPAVDPLRELLRTVDPDDLSPRSAHDLVRRLKGLAQDG